jgi:hypothetical protein
MDSCLARYTKFNKANIYRSSQMERAGLPVEGVSFLEDSSDEGSGKIIVLNLHQNYSILIGMEMIPHQSPHKFVMEKIRMWKIDCS